MTISTTYGCCSCSSCGLRWRCYWWSRCNGHFLGNCDRDGQWIGCWLYGDRLRAIFGRAKLRGREIISLTLENVRCKNSKTKEDRIHCDHDDSVEVLMLLLLIRRALQSTGQERRWKWPLYRPWLGKALDTELLTKYEEALMATALYRPITFIHYLWGYLRAPGARRMYLRYVGGAGYVFGNTRLLA